MRECGCGCGAVTKYKFANQQCRKNYWTKEIEEGRAEPDRYAICPVCEKEFWEFKQISHQRKVTCSRTCSITQQVRTRIERQGEGFKKPAGEKKKTASHYTRDTYCWKTYPDKVRRIPCAKHHETCGGGCYREEKGEPVCYVENPKAFIEPGMRGINYESTYDLLTKFGE
jgi:hypothetical protein